MKQTFLSVRPGLLRLLSARGAAPEEAEDVLQDLYVKLARGIGPVAEPRAYLFRMADNMLLDRRRSAARRTRREHDWVETEIGRRDDQHRQGIDDVLVARERLAAMERALAALPDRTADIFRRFRIDGERQRDIAAGFGISVSAVEKHLQKAYRAVLGARAKLDAEIVPPRRGRLETEQSVIGKP